MTKTIRTTNKQQTNNKQTTKTKHKLNPMSSRGYKIKGMFTQKRRETEAKTERTEPSSGMKEYRENISYEIHLRETKKSMFRNHKRHSENGKNQKRMTKVQNESKEKQERRKGKCNSKREFHVTNEPFKE